MFRFSSALNQLGAAAQAILELRLATKGFNIIRPWFLRLASRSPRDEHAAEVANIARGKAMRYQGCN